MNRAGRLLLIAPLLGASGCLLPLAARDPEYATIKNVPIHVTPTPERIAAAMMPEDPELAGPHPVETYVQFALEQNPSIQAKRKLVEAAAYRIPQARSLDDPNVSISGFPVYPNVQQTAGGRMTTMVDVSQKIPWPGTLNKQGLAAEAELNKTRAELAAEELEVVEQVKRVYFELYYIQKATAITRESRELAVRFTQLADAKVRANTASQQDLLRSQLNVAEIETQLVTLRQELQSTQARLGRLLHISPSTPVAALETLPQQTFQSDLEALYSLAITNRAELHAQLSAIERDRFQVDLAKLKYFPDVTIGMGWQGMTTNRALAPTADGIDNITMGLMANVPIYWNRLDAGVREARAKAVASARDFDAMRDETEAEVRDLFAQATSQQELLVLFRDSIIPKADQTLQVSVAAYESGSIDMTTLIDNWQELLRYQVMQQRLEAQLRQSIASLERTIGGFGEALPAVRDKADVDESLVPTDATSSDS